MQIILKKDLKSNSEEVINVFYGENDSFIEQWINTFIEQEMESLKMTPCDKNIKPDSINYFIEIVDNVFYLVKAYKVILKGYIYNSSEKVSEKLFSVRCLQFDNINPMLDKVESQPLWNGINLEIYNRVLKQVDKDSLYRINMNFDAAIKTKDTWTSTELVMLKNEITKSYKKELYSSIVKKMKKFDKKNKKVCVNQSVNTIPCKTIISNGNQIVGTSGKMPDISRFSGSCALEYCIINKKEKFE